MLASEFDRTFTRSEKYSFFSEVSVSGKTGILKVLRGLSLGDGGTASGVTLRGWTGELMNLGAWSEMGRLEGGI